jgi:N-acetylneuraminic acid mutarotase
MMKKYLLTLVLVLPLAFVSAQNSWEKKTSFPGSKRARCVAFSIASRGYIVAGEDTLDNEMNDCWEYDPGSDSWTQKANLPASGRRDAVGFAIGNKGYVGTGDDAPDAWAGNVLYDFWEYNPVTNTWLQKANYPGGFGAGVYFATGFAVNNKGYVCCGKLGASYYSQELWQFDPVSNSWVQKAMFPGGVRYGQMSFVVNGKAYVGCGTDENWFTSDFWEYNPTTNVWTQKAAFPGSNRSFGSAFALGTKGYMGMGTDGGYRDDWFEYDPLSDSWSIIATYGSEGRRSAPSFVITGAAYVIMGKGASGKHRDMWQYMPYVTGMQEFGEAGMSVYPNPVVDVLKFDIDPEFASSHDQLQIVMMSVDGKIISETPVNGNSHVELQNENWASGTYLIQLLDGNTSMGSTKIIVK